MQQNTAQNAVSQSVVNGQANKGQTAGLPAETKGAKGSMHRQQQPVDMQKLLTVSPAVSKLAAKSTDAHAMLLKVS